MTTETSTPRSVPAAADATAPTAPTGAAAPAARWRREWSDLERSARARLQATRASAVVERTQRLAERLAARAPHVVASEVDALLDRVGLVRKARVAPTIPAPTEASSTSSATSPASAQA